jgi:acyl-CoA thioester hydrolase
VYTAEVVVRQDELDPFGRLHPAVYLRYLAHAAVEASTAAGYDAAWYASAGAMWFIRRSTFAVLRPATLGERLVIRTWVEDFRRVRSHRSYEMRGADGEPRVTARTDWVYVDAATGRPRRIPPEMEQAFGVDGVPSQERAAFAAPPPPAAPALARHRVRVSEVDSVGHVNNAVYLDLLAQATLDALAEVGWPLDRMLAAGAVPVLASGDLEYLDGARYGEELTLRTWFTAAADGVQAHQIVAREDGPRPLVRASTRWDWTGVGTGVAPGVSGEVLAALRSLLAA